MLRLSFLFMLFLGLCERADETLSGYGATDANWVLKSIDGKPFTAKATVSFPSEGAITGHGPCNAFSGAQTAPYPWFETKGIASTKRACTDLEAENTFFKALSEMTISEVSEATLILSNDAKRSMIFEVE